MLPPGLYEQVINTALNRELSAIPEARKSVAPIDKAEASKVLSQYLAEVVQKGLDNLLDNGGGLSAQVELTNRIVALIQNITQEADFATLSVDQRAEQLLALLREQDPRLAVGKTAADLSRPETSIAQSSLFTGAIHEPQMYTELKKEIVSAARIDMLVSFIKWSGLRLLMDELREFTQNGGELRIITTSYMGATDVKAIEELRVLPNTKIKVSYDTKRTRLHAKTYVFYRDTGFTTAYVGSSNPSNAAISSGLEWNVKVTKKDLPETIDKIAATFESYWNSSEFEYYSEDQKERLARALKAEKYFDANNAEVYTMDIAPYSYQQEILDKLEAERTVRGYTRNLVVAATGTGKTVISALDYKRFRRQHPGKPCRLLFLAHREEILKQSLYTFRAVLKDANFGELFVGSYRPEGIDHLFLSIQTFNSQDFTAKTAPDFYDYIVVDEFHHAAAPTYQKLLSYYQPQILLGLTATPERADDKNILDIFKNTAYKLDIQTAVEIGELVPVRCIRIHTNIDLTKVRFNSVQYNIRDLESKIYVPERNQLIVDTWLQYVRDRRTVIFCASVKHAQEIAGRLHGADVAAEAVSGEIKASDRREVLARFEKGETQVLCACDLLNEGWDCPATEVLFMARPTMSKVLYAQQLGRGMRLSPGKESLMVFDFVDNASQYNMPYSMHRLFRLKEYRPGALVLGTKRQKTAEQGLYDKGERPDALIDWPVDALDYELVDIFNWQEEAAGMISQMEFVRRVDVQTETIERYVRDGLLVPDLVVPMSEHRTFKYFKEETLQKYAQQYGWTLIDVSNRKDLFLDMVRQMDMSYSYKPVLLKAVLQFADDKGRVKLSDIVTYFREFYESRRAAGLVVEKANSIYAKGGYTDAQAQRNILSNPFKRFEDMQMLHHTKTLGVIQVDESVWKKLTRDEKQEIERICDEKLEQYYSRFPKVF